MAEHADASEDPRTRRPRDIIRRVMLQFGGICLDCRDAEEMARFYSSVFGWEVTARDAPATRLGGAGWIAMTGPDGGPAVSFQAEEWYESPTWPEKQGRQTKMMHFEVGTDDLDAAIDLVTRCGGRVAPHQPADRDQSQLRVMLEPAGHPFCLGLFGT
jgi:catechol 2,3-dioxygenase-like lactoylglutathione lyase family enzyme